MKRRANREGCIQQRKDGRWMAAIRIGRNAIWLYAKTEEEVMQKFNDVKAQINNGVSLGEIRRGLLAQKIEKKRDRAYFDIDWLPEVAITASVVSEYLMISYHQAANLMECGVLKSYVFKDRRYTTKAYLEEFLNLHSSRREGVIPGKAFKSFVKEAEPDASTVSEETTSAQIQQPDKNGQPLPA